MIKVMVVDDSSVVREFLVHALNGAAGIRVVGTATNGEDAVQAADRLRPDVITMDIHMPKMNGLEATRKIMENNPVPIVIVSGTTELDDVNATFRAMEAGAVAFMLRPAGIGHPDHESDIQKLLQTVRLMSELKMVRRWKKHTISDVPLAKPAGAAKVPEDASIDLIAIGASTGGPPVLQAILTALPADFPVPILMVQHMSPGFVQGFSEWLSKSTQLQVKVAEQGELLMPAHVYIAPDNFQMGVARGGRISLAMAQSEHGLRPSVSYLFRSVIETYARHVMAGLLTGMGRDGADELRQLRNVGAVTFVQDRESSVVFGMAGEAIKLDAAMYVLPPNEIAPLLTRLSKVKKPAGGGTTS